MLNISQESKKERKKKNEVEGINIGLPKSEVRLSKYVSNSESLNRKIPVDVLKEYPKST